MFLCAYVAGEARGMRAVTEDDALRLDLINIAFGTIKDGLLWYPRIEETKTEIDRLRAVKPGLKMQVWTTDEGRRLEKTYDGIFKTKIGVAKDSITTVVIG